jgi:hypothetical protein
VQWAEIVLRPLHEDKQMIVVDKTTLQLASDASISALPLVQVYQRYHACAQLAASFPHVVYPPLEAFNFDDIVRRARSTTSSLFNCRINDCTHAGFRQVGACVNHMLKKNKTHVSGGAVLLAEAAGVPEQLQALLRGKAELKDKIAATKAWLMSEHETTLGIGRLGDDDIVAPDSSDDENEQE